MPDERVADWEHRLDRDGLRILLARLPVPLRPVLERRRGLALLALNGLAAVALLTTPLLGAPATSIGEQSLSKLTDR